MGVFGIDTYREPSLIPPDHEPEPTVEKGERAVRTLYPDGEVSWDVRGLNRSESSAVNGMMDDALEDAYELGQKSIEQQMQNLRENAQAQPLQAKADGAFIAATTAYERRETMRVTLTKQQALIAKAADSHNEVRPNLGCMRIGNGKVVAADGFMLAQAPIDYDGEPVFVPVHMIPNRPCDVDMDGESVRVITPDGTAETTHVSYGYPDTEKAWRIKTRRKPKACVALNAALLRKMLACMEGKDGGKSAAGMVRLYVRRPNDAVEWRVLGRDGLVIVEGLIEPMFTDWEPKEANVD
jgi:hypothetical protein